MGRFSFLLKLSRGGVCVCKGPEWDPTEGFIMKVSSDCIGMDALLLMVNRFNSTLLGNIGTVSLSLSLF